MQSADAIKAHYLQIIKKSLFYKVAFFSCIKYFFSSLAAMAAFKKQRTPVISTTY